MNFEKPEYKITEYVEKNNYGKFEIEPLERGFGTTIGNALRELCFHQCLVLLLLVLRLTE